jgi:hypothetical protein
MSQSNKKPYKMQIPGFVASEEIGLGDLVKRTTSFMGIKTCSGCERRAQKLNNILTFSGKKNK